MTDLIGYLQSFNRKERFYLVGTALGNPGFRLGDDFREMLHAAIGQIVPKDAFVAMDYHLDWIYASLFLASLAPDRNQNAVFERRASITASQQDVDLLVAFPSHDCPAHFHLVLVEAKLDTAWTNSQVESKAERLAQIFGSDGKSWENVTPHFVVFSPKKPTKISAKRIPDWMLSDGSLVWTKLTKPAGLRKVTRCDIGGNPDILGTYWIVQECMSAKEGPIGHTSR